MSLKQWNQHHENVDGSGYPEGLKGSDISLYSRMLNITCMYEAITRDRIYKKSILPFEAVEMLVFNVNTKLDVRLTLKFIEMLGVYPLGSTISLNNGELVQIISFDNNTSFGAIPCEDIKENQQARKPLIIQSCDVNKIISINSHLAYVS